MTDQSSGDTQESLETIFESAFSLQEGDFKDSYNALKDVLEQFKAFTDKFKLKEGKSLEEKAEFLRKHFGLNLIPSQITAFEKFLDAAQKIVNLQEEISKKRNKFFLPKKPTDPLFLPKKPIVPIDTENLSKNLKELNVLIDKLVGACAEANEFSPLLFRSALARKFGTTFMMLPLIPMQWASIMEEAGKKRSYETTIGRSINFTKLKIKTSVGVMHEKIGERDDLKIDETLIREAMELAKADKPVEVTHILIDVIMNGRLQKISQEHKEFLIKNMPSSPDLITIDLGNPPDRMTPKQVAELLSDFISCGFIIKFKPEEQQAWLKKLNDTPIVLFSNSNNMTKKENDIIIKRAAEVGKALRDQGFVVLSNKKFQDEVQQLPESSKYNRLTGTGSLNDLKRFWQHKRATGELQSAEAQSPLPTNRTLVTSRDSKPTELKLMGQDSIDMAGLRTSLQSLSEYKKGLKNKQEKSTLFKYTGLGKLRTRERQLNTLEEMIDDIIAENKDVYSKKPMGLEQKTKMVNVLKMIENQINSWKLTKSESKLLKAIQEITETLGLKNEVKNAKPNYKEIQQYFTKPKAKK